MLHGKRNSHCRCQYVVQLIQHTEMRRLTPSALISWCFVCRRGQPAQVRGGARQLACGAGTQQSRLERHDLPPGWTGRGARLQPGAMAAACSRPKAKALLRQSHTHTSQSHRGHGGWRTHRRAVRRARAPRAPVRGPGGRRPFPRETKADVVTFPVLFCSFTCSLGGHV